MRVLAVLMLVVFSGGVSALDFSSPLEDFNRMPPLEPHIVSTDSDLISRFAGKQFICTKVEEHTPKKSERAAHAFNEFLAYSIAGEREDKSWSDTACRQKKNDLHEAAIREGSWRGEYVDALLALRLERRPEVVSELLERLRILSTTVPMVMYRYGKFLWPYQNSDIYYLQDAAIDRGSPHAMTYVSDTILVRSEALFPLAKSLLECAASQGHAEAYEGLGKLAYIEGRRLDAYRLWAKGINEGGSECIVKMEALTRARANTPEKLEKKRQLLARLTSADEASAEQYLDEWEHLKFQEIQMQIPELERLKKTL